MWSTELIFLHFSPLFHSLGNSSTNSIWSDTQSHWSPCSSACTYFSHSGRLRYFRFFQSWVRISGCRLRVTVWVEPLSALPSRQETQQSQVGVWKQTMSDLSRTRIHKSWLLLRTPKFVLRSSCLGSPPFDSWFVNHKMWITAEPVGGRRSVARSGVIQN